MTYKKRVRAMRAHNSAHPRHAGHGLLGRAIRGQAYHSSAVGAGTGDPLEREVDLLGLIEPQKGMFEDQG